MSALSRTTADRIQPAVRASFLLAAMIVSSCTGGATPATQNCTRYHVPSLGADNQFRVSVGTADVPELRGSGDHFDVAMSVVPPVVGPVTVVHAADGKESRWDLRFAGGNGLSTRCRVGADGARSTCSASLGVVSIRPEGVWSLETNGNHVLEAGLSFQVCR